MPCSESLKDTADRVIPCWHEAIASLLQEGKRVLIVAHGNSLRGLVKFLGEIPDHEIPALELPTGAPPVYELDAELRPQRHFVSITH